MSLNQETNAHECLYEYKENTDFIVFIDYDDILVTSRNNYFDAFTSFHNRFSNAGLFKLHRHPAISMFGKIASKTIKQF